MAVEEFINNSNNASSVENLFDFYNKAMASVGFDRIIFSLMTDHVFIEKDSCRGLMQNYPIEWMDYYKEEDFESIDPVRNHIYSSNNIFICKDLLDSGCLSKKQYEMLNDAQNAGFYNGIGIPLRSSRGAIAGIGASSSYKDFNSCNKYSLSMANLLSQQFYTSFLELEEKKLKTKKNTIVDNKISLTDREQEILKWCSKGKTKWEVGKILSISEHTVGYHIKNTMKKLEANNISLTLIKALNMGFIQV